VGFDLRFIVSRHLGIEKGVWEVERDFDQVLYLAIDGSVAIGRLPVLDRELVELRRCARRGITAARSIEAPRSCSS